jgi:hypothetical protein
MTSYKDVMMQEQYRQEAMKAAELYRQAQEAMHYARQNQTTPNFLTRLLQSVSRVMRSLMGSRPTASGQLLRPQH